MYVAVQGRFSSAVLALRSCADNNWSFYGYVRKHVFVPDASAEAEQSINEPRAQMPPVLVLLAFEKHITQKLDLDEFLSVFSSKSRPLRL